MKTLTLCLLLIATAAFGQTRQPNHLAGERSLYLQQHVYNPVDWYPWGAEALNKARAENKLIFLSVGYSACHWCHVMEEESFENQEIADYLNEHFVSIKVDRERRPDLDEQFLFVTQALTGGGGWPNSVFLTPDGEPFHAGTYFPPDEFQQVLSRVVQVHRQDPEAVKKSGQELTTALAAYLNRKADARELTPEIIEEVARAVLPDVDFFYGGIGVTSKFPREPLFLFLLDQAERTGDRELLDSVTTMLDGMIIGGIHDHVGGGFHRYAVDPQWHVPHFEKMLYTQALTGRLLVRAWQATGKPAYRRAAQRLFSYVIGDMSSADGGFFAAQDADSTNEEGEYLEGAYYTWTPAQLADFGNDSALLSEIFQITENGELDGANVLNMPDFADVLASDLGLKERSFYARLDPVLQQMDNARRNRSAPTTDKKILVAWNAAMIATLAEASSVLERPDYLSIAIQAADFILNNMQTRTGYARIYFDGAADVPAQLGDYAALGLALIALHDHAPDHPHRTQWLAEAKRIAEIMQAKFANPDNGYLSVEQADGIGALVPVDDGELASANAMALDLLGQIARRTNAPEIEQTAFVLAAALSGHAMEVPRQRASILKAAQNLTHGSTGTVRYIAKGAVRIQLRQEPDTLVVRLDIADGWHLNSHEPLEDFYIPLSLDIGGEPVNSGVYPVPVIKSLGFNALPLALHEGKISLQVPWADIQRPAQINLTLQACSDAICLPPEDLLFQIW